MNVPEYPENEPFEPAAAVETYISDAENERRVRRKFEKFAMQAMRVKVPVGVNVERRARRFLERLYGISINPRQWRKLRKNLEITEGPKDEVLVRKEQIPLDRINHGGPEGPPAEIRGPTL